MNFAQSISGSHALLDTGCSKAICSRRWLEEYLSILRSKNIQYSLRKKSINTRFSYANGDESVSKEKVSIPVFVGNRRFILTVCVFEHTDIPLLLSLEFMKLAGLVIDCKHSTVSSPECGITDLKISSIGSHHFLLPLFPEADECLISENVFAVDSVTLLARLQQTDELTKLHRNLGHAKVTKLLNYIQAIGGDKSVFRPKIQSVVDKWTTCKSFSQVQYKSKNPGWITRFPNEVVFTDTTELTFENVLFKIIVFIDCFSKFFFARVIPSKNAESAVRTLQEYAEQTLSFPRILFSDNGSEYINELFSRFCSFHNVQRFTTEFYHPWSNGPAERANRTLKTTMEHVVSEYVSNDFCSSNPLDVSTILRETVRVLNTLPDKFGYSPNAKMFGRESRLGQFRTDFSPSELVHENDMPLILQEIEKTKQIVFDAVYSNACMDRIKAALDSHYRIQTPGKFEPGELVHKFLHRSQSFGKPHWLGPYKVLAREGENMYHISREGKSEKVYGKELRREHEVPPVHSTRVDIGTNTDENDRSDRQLSCPLCGLQFSSTYDLDTHVLDIHADSCEGTPEEVDAVFSGFKQRVPDDPNHGIISQREQIEFWEQIRGAKQDELNSWLENSVMDFVTPQDLPSEANVVSSRWVLTWKLNPDKTILKPKARLVTRGFEDSSLESLRTDSPTISRLAIRLCILYSCMMKTPLMAIDLKTAFLQGTPYGSDRLIFCRPPSDVSELLKVDPDVLFRLHKSCYGLSDAPRHFYLRVSKSLVDYRCEVSKYDKALFLYRKKSVVEGFVCVHVDDLLLSGHGAFQQHVVDRLRKDYTIGKIEEGSFTYCGLTIHSDFSTGSVTISQKEYAQLVNEVELRNLTQFQTCVGRLSWMTHQTRPDIAYETNHCSVVQRNPNSEDYKLINKIVRHVHSNDDIGIHIQHLNSPFLTVYSDASFANNRDLSSHGAFMIFMASNQISVNSVVLLDWRSTKVKRVCRSTLASETLSMSSALDHAIFVSSFWEEISSTKVPIYSYTDSMSLKEAIYSDTQKVAEKRLLVELSSIREMISAGQIESLKHVTTDMMICDSLTKFCSSHPKNRLMQVLRTCKMRIPNE